MSIFKKKNNNEFKHEKEYISFVEGSKAFANHYQDAIPATEIVSAVHRHMQSEGKTKKVAIIGFDGARADCVVPLIKTAYDKHDNSEPFSYLQKCKDCGGLFLSFTGGVKGNLQDTSTPPGWATILTGTWIDKHKVGWDGVLKDEKTILMQYAEQGKKTVFNAIWDKHFNVTYKDEIDRCKALNLPITYNMVEDNDDVLTEQIIKSVTEENCDIAFSIFEYPDHMGHTSEQGFWKQSPYYLKAISHCDKNAYKIVKAIENRPTYQDEDWLIIVTTDHGGHFKGHGSQCYTDRTTFIGTNKPELFT